MKEKHGVILMSAILPTTGHIDLIRFAADHASHLGYTAIHVIVNTRQKEPYFDRRAAWILDSLRLEPLFSLTTIPVHVYDDWDDDAPQNPEDHPNFWNFWAGKIWATVNQATGGRGAAVDYVIYASEPYGQTLADHLNGDFVPFDIGRTLNGARGTDVRAEPKLWWHKIAQGARRSLVTRVVLFGQESVGKTTIARTLDNHYLFNEWLPEFARPYLEAVGPDLSHQKMANIFAGQLATQNLLHRNPKTPIQFLDTDILSTYGYYKLKGMEIPLYMTGAVRDNLADLYVVVPDNIDFEPDPLRYGGDRRESKMSFWIGILEEFGANFVVMPSLTTQNGRAEFVYDEALRVSNKKLDPFINFQRD